MAPATVMELALAALAEASAALASLSIGNQNAVKLRCRGVLKDPTIYKIDVLRFCRMIVKL